MGTAGNLLKRTEFMVQCKRLLLMGLFWYKMCSLAHSQQEVGGKILRVVYSSQNCVVRIDQSGSRAGGGQTSSAVHSQDLKTISNSHLIMVKRKP